MRARQAVVPQPRPRRRRPAATEPAASAPVPVARCPPAGNDDHDHDHDGGDHRRAHGGGDQARARHDVPRGTRSPSSRGTRRLGSPSTSRPRRRRRRRCPDHLGRAGGPAGPALAPAHLGHAGGPAGSALAPAHLRVSDRGPARRVLGRTAPALPQRRRRLRRRPLLIVARGADAPAPVASAPMATQSDLPEEDVVAAADYAKAIAAVDRRARRARRAPRAPAQDEVLRGVGRARDFSISSAPCTSSASRRRRRSTGCSSRTRNPGHVRRAAPRALRAVVADDAAGRWRSSADGGVSGPSGRRPGAPRPRARADCPLSRRRPPRRSSVSAGLGDGARLADGLGAPARGVRLGGPRARGARLGPAG